MNEPLGNIYKINNEYWLVLGFSNGKVIRIQLDREANGQTYFFDTKNTQWSIIANVRLEPAMFTADLQPISKIDEATLLAIKEIKDIALLCFKSYMESI